MGEIERGCWVKGGIFVLSGRVGGGVDGEGRI